jgi:hypothetical protein
MEDKDYIITYIGDGNFQVEIEDGKVVEAGPNLRGMIRYTYFEDSLPDIGWSVTQRKLDEDCFPKVVKYLRENHSEGLKSKRSFWF